MFRVKSRVHDNGFERVANTFNSQGGILRTMEVVRSCGISRRAFYAMRAAGKFEQLGRGLYRLADGARLGNPDFAVVAKRAPRGVVCLISALSFHRLTTQIPHEVQLAMPEGAEPPRIKHPPVQIIHMGNTSFQAGIEMHRLDGVNVRVYSPEKTLADCFKFRNKIGLDTALEGLRLYKERKNVNVDELLRCATICRVDKVMRPYLEVSL
jgi:predicted transcriptional regulator of viral defense system